MQVIAGDSWPSAKRREQALCRTQRGFQADAKQGRREPKKPGITWLFRIPPGAGQEEWSGPISRGRGPLVEERWRIGGGFRGSCGWAGALCASLLACRSDRFAPWMLDISMLPGTCTARPREHHAVGPRWRIGGGSVGPAVEDQRGMAPPRVGDRWRVMRDGAACERVTASASRSDVRSGARWGARARG